MPISLTPYTSGTLCQGNTWDIQDRNLLVELVAKVLIGQQRHAEKILNGIMGKKTKHSSNAIQDAIKKLTLSNPKEPYHRDGLIFQIFSWIAAHKSIGKDSIISSPHLILAHKGFDGLQIDIDSKNQKINAVIIFEDKATISPRTLIKTQVWPEFKDFHAGQRESELEQQVSTLLSTRPDLIKDLDHAIDSLYWEQSRKFRISVTAKLTHYKAGGSARLFKGYDKIVSGKTVDYRNADYIHIPQLRQWMQSFSNSVIAYLNGI